MKRDATKERNKYDSTKNAQAATVAVQGKPINKLRFLQIRTTQAEAECAKMNDTKFSA